MENPPQSDDVSDKTITFNDDGDISSYSTFNDVVNKISTGNQCSTLMSVLKRGLNFLFNKLETAFSQIQTINGSITEINNQIAELYDKTSANANKLFDIINGTNVVVTCTEAGVNITSLQSLYDNFLRKHTGIMGSFSYTGSEINVSWYSFISVPHRTGLVVSGGDNDYYRVVWLTTMTSNGPIYKVLFTNGQLNSITTLHS